MNQIAVALVVAALLAAGTAEAGRTNSPWDDQAVSRKPDMAPPAKARDACAEAPLAMPTQPLGSTRAADKTPGVRPAAPCERDPPVSSTPSAVPGRR